MDCKDPDRGNVESDSVREWRRWRVNWEKGLEPNAEE